MTRIVYRFENDRRIGPFHADATRYYDRAHRCRDRNHSCRHMPSPWSAREDRKFFKYTEYGSYLHEMCEDRKWAKKILTRFLFGFTTLKQIRLAFPSSVGRVEMQQYASQHIMVYGVDDAAVIQGYYQCVFQPEYAQLIGQLDMKTLRPIEGLDL